MNTYLPFDRWLKDVNKSAHHSILDDLNYFPIVNYYAKLFGRDGLGLFLFEDLRKDPISYSKQLADYLGVDPVLFCDLIQKEKKNLTVTQQYIDFWIRWGLLLPHRLTRKLSKRVANKPGVPARVDIGDRGRKTIYRLCAEGNRTLANEYRVDLENYGYTMV